MQIYDTARNTKDEKCFMQKVQEMHWYFGKHAAEMLLKYLYMFCAVKV